MPSLRACRLNALRPAANILPPHTHAVLRCCAYGALHAAPIWTYQGEHPAYDPGSFAALVTRDASAEGGSAITAASRLLHAIAGAAVSRAEQPRQQRHGAGVHVQQEALTPRGDRGACSCAKGWVRGHKPACSATQLCEAKRTAARAHK